jgi:hypothetical protein
MDKVYKLRETRLAYFGRPYNYKTNEWYFKSHSAAQEHTATLMEAYHNTSEWPEWKYLSTEEKDSTQKWWIVDWIDNDDVGPCYTLEITPIELMD